VTLPGYGNHGIIRQVVEGILTKYIVMDPGMVSPGYMLVPVTQRPPVSPTNPVDSFHEIDSSAEPGHGSNLNLKVWTTDDEGNFTKFYPRHNEKRRSSANLNQEERKQLYQEIESHVQEKYFNRCSSIEQDINRATPTGKPPVCPSGKVLARHEDYSLPNPIKSWKEVVHEKRQENLEKHFLLEKTSLLVPNFVLLVYFALISLSIICLSMSVVPQVMSCE